MISLVHFNISILIARYLQNVDLATAIIQLHEPNVKNALNRVYLTWNCFEQNGGIREFVGLLTFSNFMNYNQSETSKS